MTNEGCHKAALKLWASKTISDPLTEVLMKFQPFHRWMEKSHIEPAVKDRYLSVSLQTIPASYCNVARLWFPDPMRPTSCLFVTLVLIFLGVGQVQWDFHRLVFLLYTCMVFLYIHMKDCAFTCSCLDCHPHILNKALKNPKDTEWEKSFWRGMEKKERHLNSIRVSEWLEIPN